MTFYFYLSNYFKILNLFILISLAMNGGFTMKVVEWDRKENINKILIDILEIDPKFSFDKEKEDIYFLYNEEDLYGYAVLSLNDIAELKKIFPATIFKKAKIIFTQIANFEIKSIFSSCFFLSLKLFNIYPSCVLINRCFSRKLFIFL